MNNMKRAALVEDGAVTNVIIIMIDPEGNPSFVSEEPGIQVIDLPLDSPVSIGWKHVNGEFVEPDPEPDDE